MFVEGEINLNLNPFRKMHVIKLNITGEEVGSETFFEFAEYYFDSLYGTNQITNEERQYERIENGLSVRLICPEKESYLDNNTNFYALEWKKRIEEELECKFEFNYIGLDPEFEQTEIPEHREFLILKSGGFSPVIEGKSLNPIPLYQLPYTYQDGKCFSDINSWDNNYIRVRGLWFNGAVGERWAQNQLQNHNSELSKQGIKCCQKIEKVTGIPTYYFLFSYRAWGQKKERERKCPNCGGDWLVENKTSDDFYAFQCHDCRLISELSKIR